jgi:hypothetical protein
MKLGREFLTIIHPHEGLRLHESSVENGVQVLLFIVIVIIIVIWIKINPEI